MSSHERDAHLQARIDLVERLRSRRGEIEEAVFARVCEAGPDAAGKDDAEYREGLRATVAAVVDYGLMGIEHGEERVGQIPPVAVAQAHRAARKGVRLETVLLRYAVGHRLLGDFVMAEADHLPRQALRNVLDIQSSLLESLMVGVSSEHKSELERAGRSFEQRRAERLRKLLAGEPVDVAELDFEFDAWHLGVIVTGARAGEAVRDLAARLDCRLLLVSHGQESVWAWFSGRRSLSFTDVDRVCLAGALVGVTLAVGEPGYGIDGWRQTHRQAQAALLVALRRPQRLTRYADVALVALALQDNVLARSFRECFLSPLDGQRDGGAASRETLRAYFAARCNASATAAALGVARHTVENRLRTVEHGLGRSLHTCAAELELALRLDQLDRAGDVDKPPRPFVTDAASTKRRRS